MNVFSALLAPASSPFSIAPMNSRMASLSPDSSPVGSASASGFFSAPRTIISAIFFGLFIEGLRLALRGEGAVARNDVEVDLRAGRGVRRNLRRRERHDLEHERGSAGCGLRRVGPR